jgi:hypothetical protein
LRYPVLGGSSLSAITDALRRVIATGRVAALGLAYTWDLSDPASQHSTRIIRQLGWADLNR